MPMINVQILPGRTSDQKRALIKGLAEVAIATLGVPEEAVRVLLTEVDPDHWSIGTRTIKEIRSEPTATSHLD